MYLGDLLQITGRTWRDRPAKARVTVRIETISTTIFHNSTGKHCDARSKKQSHGFDSQLQQSNIHKQKI